MVDRRSGLDRRANKDRRKGRSSSYNGLDIRSNNQQRSNIDRRVKIAHGYMNRLLLPDGEVRRTGIDQRQYSYAGNLPERRSGKDRRRLS